MNAAPTPDQQKFGIRFFCLLFGPFLVSLIIMTIGRVLIPVLDRPYTPDSFSGVNLLNQLAVAGMITVGIAFLIFPILSARQIVRGARNAFRRIVGGLVLWLFILGANLFLGMLSCTALML